MKLLALLLLIVPTFLYAQELKKITKNDKSAGTEEIFFVLKSDNKIRHGSYQKLISNEVRVSGYFKNGKEDSLWIEYSWRGKVTSKGYYTNGSRTGVWEFYENDGKLNQKFDYDKREVLYNEPSKTKNTDFKLLKDTLPADKVSGPVYIGGDYEMFMPIVKNIQYPQFERDNDIQGKVIVSFVIDANGNTNSHKVLTSISKGLDDEALRVVKMIPSNWIPAKVNNTKVDCEYTVPVVFRLM